MNTRIGVSILVSIFWLSIGASKPAFAEKHAADLLPPTTVVYAELPEPKKLLDVLLDHPLRERVESLADYRARLESDEFQQFKAVVTEIEKQIGLSWRPAHSTLLLMGRGSKDHAVRPS
jgi:hypothetical protein